MGGSYKGGGCGEDTSVTIPPTPPGTQPALSAEAAGTVCGSKGAEGPISQLVPTLGPRWRLPGFPCRSSDSCG